MIGANMLSSSKAQEIYKQLQKVKAARNANESNPNPKNKKILDEMTRRYEKFDRQHRNYIEIHGLRDF